MSRINHKLGQPIQPSNTDKYLLCSHINFSNGKIPIFWGPNQDTQIAYETPQLGEWNFKTLFSLPAILRFHFSPNDINLNDYVPPPPPGPPINAKCFCTLVDSRLIRTFEGCSVYYTYWRIFCHNPLGGTGVIPCDDHDFSKAFICQTPAGPDYPSCHPKCNSDYEDYINGRSYNVCACAGRGQQGSAPPGDCTSC